MSDDPYAHDGSNTRRLDRVETEVDALRGVVSEVRSDIRSVVVAVGEIKDSLKTRDSREAEERHASRPNIYAISAVLFSVLSALIGGAWIIGGTTARLDERDIQRDKQLARIELEMDRIEARQWNGRRATETAQ